MTLLVRTITELRAALASRPAPIALVPTMGSLHDGHRALMSAARGESATVVVSLFVNAPQFTGGEDFARYPRDEDHDLRVAQTEYVDVLVAPAEDEIYPPGYASWLTVDGFDILEGAVRPGHFRGVATVCLKLFTIVQPDRAYFGQKDAQQVALVRRVIADLALPIELCAIPTVRDADGLALSSRNVYLSEAERQRASVLPDALRAGLRAHRSGSDPVDAARTVLQAADNIAIDYVDIGPWQPPTLVAAIRVGATRLIDNVPLTPDSVEP
jgi:pantoate--beta-alanine ligase